LRQLEKVGGELSLKVTTENGIAFFCGIAIQTLIMV
jgi:hypothetical protein